MNPPVVRAIWTPQDAVVFRQLADEFPREVGQSQFLADIFEMEGL